MREIRLEEKIKGAVMPDDIKKCFKNKAHISASKKMKKKNDKNIEKTYRQD